MQALSRALPASVRVSRHSASASTISTWQGVGARHRSVQHADVLSVATAETALLLILAAARRAGEGERLIRSGRWHGWAPTQLLGVGVVGRRLGIFGMGRLAVNWRNSGAGSG